MNKVKSYEAHLKVENDSSINYEECVTTFQGINTNNGEKIEFKIISNEKIYEFDFTIIGHLILMKKEKPYLEIQLIFNKNTFYKNESDGDDDENDILWKVRQSMVHAYFSSGIDVFSIVDANGEIVDINSEKQRKKNWFVFSTEFLPITYICESNYDIVFEKGISFLPLKNPSVELKSEEYFYRYCRDLLITKKTNDNYYQILTQLAFYKSLQAVRSLRYFLVFEEKSLNVKIDRDNIYVGNVQDNDKKDEYRKKVIPIFNELKLRPPIYSFIFCTLTSSKKFIASEISNENIENISNELLGLWEFTKELIYGINELAKNIIQHSSTKQGILSGSINKNNEFRINVFDYGNKSIITTLKQETKETFENSKKDSILKKLFEEDYNRLHDDSFKFSYLFDSQKEHLLNQQTKRATIHLGLLIFSRLISENEGKLFVSSNDTERQDFHPKEGIIFKHFPVGTNFQILLPTKTHKNSPYNQITSPKLQNAEDALSIEKLLFYEDDQGITNLYLKKTNAQGRTFEKNLWDNLEEQLHQKLNEPHINDKIICVWFSDIEGLINSSQLFRFLGNWELYHPTLNLIIYDINIELYFELLEINKSFLSIGINLPYWNSDAITLFYSFLKLAESGEKFYFTDAMWGKKRDDFIYINRLIQKNNYNALSYYPGFSKKTVNPNRSVSNKIFYNNSTLLPFDLIIKNQTNTTIFESNAKALLCNELRDKESVQEKNIITSIQYIEKQIQNLPGFKISDSHFRLGSKIHITDFYYAKRFFQNSFYASRFAFIVAKHILKEHLLEKNIPELTLVGYGLYSELLLSLTVRYISKYCVINKRELKINHHLVTDTEEEQEFRNIYKNVVIIVPIASTFSTSMKIEEKLKGLDKNILEPYINILVVSNGNINLKSTIQEKTIEKKYGWSEVFPEKKVVLVTSFNKACEIEQKYFLALSTIWYDIDNCKDCSPQEVGSSCIDTECSICHDKNIPNKCPLSEKPLLITDKTSVTPAFIFGFPISKKIPSDDKNRKSKLSLSSLEYGHTERNNQHFHYHIYDEVFLEENKKNVEKWLKKDVTKKIRQGENYGINYTESDNVLIIAPKHFSNSAFVNIVNELLFSNSANILHYDFWNNNIENFQIFYSDIVYNADKIFFIDDTIVSGSTFLRSNDFIKQTRGNAKEQNNEKKYGFDACIFLIDRIDFFTQQNIYRKLKNDYRFFAFASLNLPLLNKNSIGKCQICLDYDRLKALFDSSYLYRFKYAFLNRIEKLKLKKISAISAAIPAKSNTEINKPFENTNQNIIKIELIHRIFEYFDSKENKVRFINFNNVDEWVQDLIAKTDSPFENDYIVNNQKSNNHSTNADIALKVLAHAPFNNYKPIKEKTFIWTVLSLNDQIEYLKKSNFKDFDYDNFRNLKYRIRRVGLINSNYLISDRFILFIIKLYKSNWLESLKNSKREEINKIELELKGWGKSDQNNAFSASLKDKLKKANKEYESIEENTNDFATFVVSQIKELLYQNESRSILIETQILKNHKEKSISLQLDQFFRILREENGILIQKFWEFYHERSPSTLDEIALQNHYQYNTLVEFLNAAQETSPKENITLKKYLTIQSILFEFKHTEKNISLEEKTNKLCNHLNDLFFEKTSSKSGTFLIVNYRSEGNLDDLFLAYNNGSYSSIIAEGWKNDNYVTRFIDGVTNGNKQFLITIEVLEKKDDGIWNSLYAIPDEEEIKIDFLNKCSDIKYVLCAKLALKEIDKETRLTAKHQGVIVFYSDINVFNISKTRYLLLLKHSISNFINEHHKNDEFRDWVENNKVLDIVRKSKIKYEKAFYNFNHDTVSKVIEQWNYFENNPQVASGNLNLYSSSYKVGANIINSNFFAFLVQNKKIKELSDFIYDKVSTSELLPTPFVSILESLLKDVLCVKKYSLFDGIPDTFNLKIEKFAFRAFLILLLQNIDAHSKSVLCTEVSLCVKENELVVINKFQDAYSQTEIEKYNHRRELILEKRVDELEKGTTLITIKQYCDEHNIAFEFELDNSNKQFVVKIKNKFV